MWRKIQEWRSPFKPKPSQPIARPVHKHQIAVRLNGRLGNNLFQIASCIGIARANGMEWSLLRKHAKRYKGIIDAPVFVEKKYDVFSEPSFNFNPVRLHRPTILRGFFQSWKYFERSQDEVREVFRNLLPSISQEFCSIHVRRGDYLRSKKHRSLGKDYYDEAMRRMNASSYMIFSDDFDWCEQNFDGVTFSESTDRFSDLYLQATAKCHIIANSTFSWWGAWFGGGRTIVPKRWFDMNDLNADDLIVPGWETI